MTADLPPIDSYVTLRCRVARVNPKAGVFLLDTNAEGPWYRPDHPDIVAIERPATPLAWGEPVTWSGGPAFYVGRDPAYSAAVIVRAAAGVLACTVSISHVVRPDGGAPIDWAATFIAHGQVETP